MESNQALNPADSCPLLRLPPELRLEIYSLVLFPTRLLPRKAQVFFRTQIPNELLAEDETLVDHDFFNIDPTILGTNKQIHPEAKSMLYKALTFYIKVSTSDQLCVRALLALKTGPGLVSVFRVDPTRLFIDQSQGDRAALEEAKQSENYKWGLGRWSIDSQFEDELTTRVSDPSSIAEEEAKEGALFITPAALRQIPDVRIVTTRDSLAGHPRCPTSHVVTVRMLLSEMLRVLKRPLPADLPYVERKEGKERLDFTINYTPTLELEILSHFSHSGPIRGQDRWREWMEGRGKTGKEDRMELTRLLEKVRCVRWVEFRDKGGLSGIVLGDISDITTKPAALEVGI